MTAFGQKHDVLRLGSRRTDDVQAELKRDLLVRPHPVEQIAQRLRKETTLWVKQIAGRLHLGTPKSASVILLAAPKKQAPGNSAQGPPGI